MVRNLLVNNMKNQESDLYLVKSAVKGNPAHLEKLILRHQDWIYNITLRMVYDPDDALDITQEIIIKIMTKLSTFNEHKASFRTWLYRIVANHVINIKKSRYKYTFDFDDAYFDMIPDENPAAGPETNLLIQELKISCFMGSLLCLKPRDRLVFILSAVLNVTVAVGSEVMEISRVNYRQILSRSRNKLFDYLNGNCGLLDPANKCHCAKKINGCIRVSLLDPDNIVFHKTDFKQIYEMIHNKFEEMDSYWNDKMNEFICRFRRHPFYESKELRNWLFKTMENGESLLGQHVKERIFP